MNYVSVPEDFSKVKNKVFFYLTARQLICFGIAAVYGVVFYLFARQSIGTDIAMMGTVVIMLPGFFAGIYERNGRYAEQVIWDMITFFILRPQIRRYEMETTLVKRKEQLHVRQKDGKRPQKRKKAERTKQYLI